MIFHQIYCRKCFLFFITKTIEEPCPICGNIILADYHKGNKMNINIQRKMKIYIAASHPKIKEAKLLSEKLIEFGFEIISLWHEQDKSADYNSTSRAIRDYSGVEQCDLFVEIIGDDYSRGGRHCELGLALAWNKKIILIGSNDGCVFTNLPWLPRMKNIEEFLKKIC